MDGNSTPMYTMPVAPAYNGGGFGDFGGNGWWIILLFLFAGGFGGFGGYGNNAGAFVGADVQRGFDQAAVANGIGDLQNDITAGFANLYNAINSNQIAGMNQNFGMQTSVLQGFNGIQQQLSQCCCDNRLATVQTQNVVQAEGAATRSTIQDSVQKVMDKLCALEIDNLKGEVADLTRQLSMANLAASQTAQTAQIIAALTPTV